MSLPYLRFEPGIEVLPDSAFVDRADIVQYIDLPTREAIYEILRSCLCEIMSKGVVASTVTIKTLARCSSC